MRFTKLPVTIEAFQWTGGRDQTDDPAWIVEAIKRGKVAFGTTPINGDPSMLIDTLEGCMTASPGDWIIRGIEGEIYPCKPDIFEAIYAPEPEFAEVEPTFEQELCALINRHSMENHSDTPDFILCEFLRKSLETFDIAVRLRERWYGREDNGPAPDHPDAESGWPGGGESTPLYQISEPELEEIEKLLTINREQFSLYETHHRAKTHEEGREQKAEVNRKLAEANDTALRIIAGARANREPTALELGAALRERERQLAPEAAPPPLDGV